MRENLPDDDDSDTDDSEKPLDGKAAESAAPFEPGHASTAAEDLLPKPVETNDADTIATMDNARIHSIPKHTYCHRCEHFSAPPAVSCLHEGTTILEVERLDTFRVSNCPVAIEAEELEGRR